MEGREVVRRKMSLRRVRTAPTILRCAVTRVSEAWKRAGESGMSTAEYAVGTIAACGFAAVLYKIVTSEAVQGRLQQLIERALSAQL